MKKFPAILKAFFTKDLGIKFVSVLVASILWFVVMNIQNPTETKSFSVPLTLLNADKLEQSGLTVLNIDELQTTKAEIKVMGTRPALDELNKTYNRESIKAEVDLANLALISSVDLSAPFTLSVIPRLPSSAYLYSYEIVSSSPGTVQVQLDKLTTKNIPVTLQTNGEVATGYVAKDTVLDPEAVTLSGASLYVEGVSKVVADIDISDLKSSVNQTLELKAIDEAGVAIEQVGIEPATVNVRIDVSKQGHITVVKPEILGELDDNYELEGIDWSPKTIEIEGNAADVASISEIKIPDIDISGYTESNTLTYSIKALLGDKNVRVKSDSPGDITVEVNISEKETSRLTIEKDNIIVNNADESAEITVLSNASVTVRASESVLEDMKGHDIIGHIDASKLVDGRSEVDVTIQNLPEGVEIINKPTVRVELTRVEEITEITTEEIVEPPVEQAEDTTQEIVAE